jgi:inner membrane protein
MDNLTHTLVGLMLSRAGLDRGDRHTPLILMLAANVPDVDAYPFFTDPVGYLDIHRGYTHALVFAPLMALLPVLAVKGVARSRPTLGSALWLWFAATLAVLSHLLLDWTNVYGVRLLLPFSGRWLRADITNVVDPLIWVLLMLCWVVPSILGLVSAEIGAKNTMGLKRGWAWLALVALVGYEGWRWSSHERAVGALSALLYRDEVPKNVWAFPDSFGTLRWRGLVEGEEFFYEVPIDFSGNFTLRDGNVDYKVGHSKLVEAARTTRTFQVFERFNQVPFWRISPLVDVSRVELMDLRFGSFTRGNTFTATAMVEPDGRIQDVRFGFGK